MLVDHQLFQSALTVLWICLWVRKAKRRQRARAVTASRHRGIRVKWDLRCYDKLVSARLR